MPRIDGMIYANARSMPRIMARDLLVQDGCQGWGWCGPSGWSGGRGIPSAPFMSSIV